MSRKVYTDTTKLPKVSETSSCGDNQKVTASVKRLPLKEFSIWMGFKAKTQSTSAPSSPKTDGGSFPGVQHFTDNKV